MYGRTEVEGRVRVVQPEVREERTYANPGDGTRIVVLDGRRGAHKIERHARINAKVTRKVVAESGSKIVDGPLAAVAIFELGSQCPSGSEASRVSFCRTACGRVRGLGRH